MENKTWKHLLLVAICIIGYAQHSQAQNYGNEWINYGQSYYKVSVAQEGMYQLSRSALDAAGFPTGSVDPRSIQLFRRGREQSIFVSGEQDGQFDDGDYIAFYGVPNDGKEESRLYEEGGQPHDLYSLYSDTAAYFLTWSSSSLGKRMSTSNDNNTAGLTPASHHLEETLRINAEEYSLGASTNNVLVTETAFVEGEGFSGVRVRLANSLSYELGNLTNRVTTAGNPKLEVLMVGRDNSGHQAQIAVGPSEDNLRVVGTESGFINFQTRLFGSEIAWSDLSDDGRLFVSMTTQGIGGNFDQISISYIRLTFPQGYNMEGLSSKKFYLPTSSLGRSLVNINTTIARPDIYDITDTENIVTLSFQNITGGVSTVVPNTELPRVVFVNDGTFLTPQVEAITMEAIDPALYDYIIVSHQSLMQPAGGVSDAVQAYADYRSSPIGGGHDVLVADIEALNNQFNFGERSPLSLRDFMRFFTDNGTANYLFIIGKGLLVNTRRRGLGFYRNNPSAFLSQDLIPTAGSPGSDNLFTTGLGGEDIHVPLVPTGRVTTSTPAQVMAYLDKVKEMEALPFDDLWRKNILHLSGGISQQEISRFLGYVNGFKQTATTELLGGNVSTITKSTDEVVEVINIADAVNEGVSLITFYGHSAPTVTDIEIGNVSDPTQGYNNEGRYAMFLINGCNAGGIFSEGALWGEDWILTPNRGAIGFLAHSYFGFESPLRNYSDLFYNTAFADSNFVSQPIGDIHKQTSQLFFDRFGKTNLTITQVTQMILMGDPAVRLFGATKPDLSTNNNSLFVEATDGEPINTLTPAIRLGAIIRNFGLATSDSVTYTIRRTFSDNSTVEFDTLLPATRFQDTVFFTFENTPDNSFGNNKFEVTIDSRASLDELDEDNNYGVLNQFVPLNGTQNLFPLNFAIANQQPVRLVAQPGNVQTQPRDFVFQIDTTSAFNSAFLQTSTVASQSIAEWTPNLLPDVPANDSTVYYWRTRFSNPLPGEVADWANHSFTYIQGSPAGWSQSQATQYQSNTIEGITLDTIAQRLSFFQNEIEISAKTFGNSLNSNPRDTELTIDGVPFINQASPCSRNAVVAVAFDRSTLQPYPALETFLCGRFPRVLNSFQDSRIRTQGLMETYLDAVNPGDYVLIYTTGLFVYDLWPASVITALEGIGADSSTIAGLATGDAYMVLGIKGGDPGSALEVTGGADDEITLGDASISGGFVRGNITTPLIGPATAWQSFVNQTTLSETPQSDLFHFQIIGIDNDGAETVIMDEINTKTTDLSSIDPNIYPQLKVNFFTEDETQLTPTQLNQWQVLYEGVPDGALFFSDPDQPLTVRLQEGQSLTLPLSFFNISTFSFPDSLTVVYNITNQSTLVTTSQSIKILNPAPGDTTNFILPIGNETSAGINNLSVTVNPEIFPEQHRENNVLNLPGFLQVEADNKNPIIEVVFDGEFIFDGEIVSPNPNIEMRLIDDSQFVFKTDTLGFDIFFKENCEGCEFEKIYFSSPEVSWTPASDTSDFKVNFRPQRLADGNYALQVNAFDVSGNIAGEQPYLINFEVVNALGISNFYPYPNPFSSSTRFAFTFTGAEVPDEVNIRILTIWGKVVREITLDEKGPIRGGRNLTEFEWHGEDQNGNLLPNGLYLYQVRVRLKGQPLPPINVEADRNFDRNFGKLYLLR